MTNFNITEESEMMRDMYKISKNWSNIECWLSWADSKNMVFRIFEKNKLAGFAVVRPIKSIDDAEGYYNVEKDGNILWIDIACSKIHNGTKMLWNEIIKKLNNFKYIAFKRNGGNAKIYNFNRFTELMKVGA